MVVGFVVVFFTGFLTVFLVVVFFVSDLIAACFIGFLLAFMVEYFFFFLVAKRIKRIKKRRIATIIITGIRGNIINHAVNDLVRVSFKSSVIASVSNVNSGVYDVARSNVNGHLYRGNVSIYSLIMTLDCGETVLVVVNTVSAKPN